MKEGEQVQKGSSGSKGEGGGFAASIYGAMPEGSIQVTSYKKKPCHQKDGMAFRMLYFVDHLFFQRKSLAVEMAREREGEKPYSKKERRVSFQLVIAAINI